jgi:aspartyl/glutamyl-tRNA(Asn/Gln) amidotransferase C subunit
MQDALLNQLCALARIELSPAERDDFKAKFEGLLDFVEQVQTYAAQGEDVQSGELGMHGELTPRRDVAVDFEWPAGITHDYRVPQVIAFGEDAE